MKSHMLGFSAVLLWLLVSSSKQEDARKLGCLTTKDTKVPQKYLRSYTIQHKPLFPVHAVRFLTVKGITICSSPTSPWAIKSMEYLDAKKKRSQPKSNIAIRPSVTVIPYNASSTNVTQ